MNLEPAPRLPKWIFLAIDAGLLLIAFLIVSFAKDPYAPLPFVSAVLCAALAAIVGFVPFLIDYAADSAEFVQRERERMNEQAARLHAGGESLARAAAHIKAVEEAVHKSARDAETLPYRMQEKLAEFNETLAAREESDREALETELEQLRATNGDQLKSVADKISKAAADWAALEVATRKQLTAAEAALAKLQAGSADAGAKFEAQVAAALRDLDAKIAELKEAAARVPTGPVHTAPSATAAVAAVDPRRPEPAEKAEIPSPAAIADNEVTAPAIPDEPSPAATEPAITPENTAPVSSPATAGIETAVASAAIEPPKPKKPRAPRKPKPEETLAAMSDTPDSTANGTAPASAATEPDAAAAPVAALARSETPTSSSAASEPVAETSAPADNDSAETAAAGPAESSTSSDGATRLLATAYIGIGNKLFIRGDGPGLSWDHGVPMQFVSIGKWGWSTHDAAGPVRCKLFKNDESAALTGEIVLEAGRHTEVTAMF